MATKNVRGTMAIYFILLGILLCSIIITTVQIKLAHKKEMNELMDLFEDIPR
jgi:Na+-transporting NADH:ubiquinone oxidoreductase subunit NqrC